MTKMTNSGKEESNIKIASWNINKFESSSILEIAKIIVGENLDVIFLQEFPTYNIHNFINKVNAISKTQYELISQQPLYEKDYNITLVLIKEDLKTYTKAVPMIDDIPFKLRLIELELSINDNTINILGLHCPIYVNKRDNLKRSKQIDTFWDKLLAYSKSKDLILIGDFNVNLLKRNRFTRQMKGIISNEYIDLDSEAKQNTFIADTRIDYVLIPKIFMLSNQNIAITKAKYLKENLDSQFQYSDHKLIVFEFAI